MKESESGVYVTMLPAELVVVCWVVVVPVTGSVVMVVVVSCARAMPSAAVHNAPAAKIFSNLVCFIFVLLLSLNGCAPSACTAFVPCGNSPHYIFVSYVPSRAVAPNRLIHELASPQPFDSLMQTLPGFRDFLPEDCARRN